MITKYGKLSLRWKTVLYSGIISLLFIVSISTFLIAHDIFKETILFDPIMFFSFLVFVFMVVLYLLNCYQIMLIRPVNELVATAKTVSENKDYTIRAPGFNKDEFGRMTGAFNEMLDQIHLQDFELKKREKEFRKLYEESQKAEKVYRSLINSSADPIVLYDTQGQINYVSPAFTAVFGWEVSETTEMAVRFVPSSEHSALQLIFKDLIQNKESFTEYETKRYTKDNDMLDVNISASCFDDHEGKPAGILMILRDMSERKRLEAQLVQSQKMEAIGTLAGGIAHDFNNILGAMMGYSELMLLDMAEDSTEYYNLQQVLSAGMRAKDLVKQILTFSRQKEQDRVPVMIDKIVTEALKLLRASLPATIEIRVNILPVKGNIMADPTQVHQILMNLCTNAAHAMENSGVLEVLLEEVSIKDDGKKYDPGSGEYIKLMVKDTGDGMDRATVKRIFEPYFTTKEQGKGTGMGLAVVHGIVKAYGGVICVQSKKGDGTTFKIFFPKIENIMVPNEGERKPLSVGNERILFVDDEKTLAELGKSMLGRLGYNVITRTSPIEAVEAFRNNPGNYDLVITDMTMPQMTGDVLAKEIMKIRPDIPVILCTGYSELMTEEKASASGIRDFFMKPFVLRDLADTVRNVLDY